MEKESGLTYTLKQIPKNVWATSIISFLVQIGSGLIYGTGNAVISGILFSPYTFLLLRNLTDAMPNAIKPFAGFLSDRIRNRKAFLLIGYGGVTLLKVGFFVSTLVGVFPISVLAAVYLTSHFLDRFANLRDATRDALITDSTPQDLQGICFGIRKGIGSLGSVLGGILAFVLLQQKVSAPVVYFLAIWPVAASGYCVYKLIKDVQEPDLSTVKSFDWPSFFLKTAQIFLYGTIIFFLIGSLPMKSFFDFGQYKFTIICSILVLLDLSYKVLSRFNMLSLLESLALCSSLIIMSKFGTLFAALGFFAAWTSITWILSEIPGYVRNSLFNLDIEPVGTTITLSIVALLSMSFFHLNLPTKLPEAFFLCLTYLFGRATASSEMVRDLKAQGTKMFPFFSVMFFVVIIAFCQLSPTALFQRSIEVGLPKNYTILLFVLQYFTAGAVSFVFSYLLGKGMTRFSLFLMLMCLAGSNAIVAFTMSKVMMFLTMILSGVYIAGLDSVFVSLVASSIPSQYLRGTIFGVYYAVAGLIGVVAGLTGYNLSAKFGISTAATVCFIASMVCTVLLLLRFMYLSNTNKKDISV